MTEASDVYDVETANKKFWEEPCGTNSYNSLGFNSKQDFDFWFFNFYSYLDDFIPFNSVKGKKVLEVGLGMGSVSERLGKEGAEFYGMDIAKGPVEGVNERFSENNFDGKAVVGDVLNCPWDDNYFDYVISIGCLHHTGDFYKAVDELVRVLKPGGQGVFMVYNAFSYRQWLVNPLRTLIKCYSCGFASSIRGEEDERGMYDCNSRGEAAPATEFLGRKEIFNYMTELKTQVKIRSENIGSYFLFPLPRSLKLKLFSSYLGLDLYVNFLKEEN